jgi:hypothetical protein
VSRPRIGLHAAGAGVVGGTSLPHQLPVVPQAGEWLLGGDRAHVGGLGTLAALSDVELDGLACFQPVTFLDSADMDEHVVAGLRLDEALAHVGVEPLDGSGRHAAGPPPAPRGIDHPAPDDTGGK